MEMYFQLEYEIIDILGNLTYFVHYDCSNRTSMESFGEFFNCLRYFTSKSFLKTCILLGFSISTFLLNLIVIILINKNKHKKNVFDIIFAGHCFVDAQVGLLVIPNYCVYSVFGYWPLGKSLCHVFVSLDYTICHVGIMHMVFIAYARLRSLIAPKDYQKEFLIKNPKLVIVMLWILSGALWLPSINVIIDRTFNKGECYFNYHPVYIVLQDIFAYIIPMLIIISITFYMTKIIHETKKNHRKFFKDKIKMKPQTSITSSPNSSSNVVIKNNKLSTEKCKINEQKCAKNEFKRIKLGSERNNLIKFNNSQTSNNQKSRISSYTKLYVIIITFCLFWLPFCILWPIFSLCPRCIPDWLYQMSYWVGYAQSLVNPILLIILNSNYH